MPNSPDPTLDEDDLQPEYDFSGGERGRYASRLSPAGRLVALDPDVAARFPDAASVNAALRALVAIADRRPAA